MLIFPPHGTLVRLVRPPVILAEDLLATDTLVREEVKSLALSHRAVLA